MKTFTLFFMICILGCQSKKENVRIELMSYNYEYTAAEGNKPSFNSYFLLNDQGFSQNLHIDTSTIIKSDFSKIDKILVSKIIHSLTSKNENHFLIEKQTSFGCYLRPFIRLKITNSDGAVKSFLFFDREYDQNSKFYEVKFLYDKLVNSFKKSNKNKNVEKYLLQKKEEFCKYTVIKDMDQTPVPMPPPPPPAPKIEDVKFTE